MKKSILILFFIIPITVFSQENPLITGLLGIEFGSSKEKVIQVMKAKGYGMDTKSKNPTFLKVKYGVFTNCDIVFSFVNDKFYQSLIILPTILEAKIIEQYDDLNTELEKKYGKGESYTNFKYPYEKGDGHEITAIRLGKAEYNTYWSDSKGAINSYISPEMFVCVKYQDVVLIKEAIKLQTQKNSADY